ncbi:hypothetical protein JW796_03290 [Candidatus Dojkabacteria bacterium]|nr:hypothetical protein [Candidatus Dojkabacteria bacterium]
MKNFLINNRRGIFYGFFISIGLIFLVELMINLEQKLFFIASIILYLVFVFEVLTSQIYSKKILAQMEIPQVDTYSKFSQFTHHLLLPTALYMSCLGIIYYYHLTLPKYFFFFICFFIFTLMFINIRAYYEDKFKLEERTHYIYDIIKFITFFQLTNTILETINYFGFDPFLSYVLIGMTAFMINTIVTIRRNQFNYLTIIFNLITTLVIIETVVALSSYTNFSILATSSYTLLVFYITSAILHHKLEGSLKKEVLLEYLVVLLLSLVILQGLSS